MIINSSSVDNISLEDVQGLPSKPLNREFGFNNDSIELTVSDANNNFLFNDPDFKTYTPDYLGGSTGTFKRLNIDFVEAIRQYGIGPGIYNTKYSFQRKLISPRFTNSLYITEISADRTEIRAQSFNIADGELATEIYSLQTDILNSIYVPSINLIFGTTSILILNVDVDNTTNPLSVLFKLYDPLPTDIGLKRGFRVAEEVINPLEVTVELDVSDVEDDFIELSPANFTLDVEKAGSKPSGLRSYNDILGLSATSSLNNLLNSITSSIPINLEFDNTDTPTGYHFENFVHFGSAVERLKNFEYKLKLIEEYQGELDNLDGISGDVTSSSYYLKDKNNTQIKINNLIRDFDPYERFLYFESGAYSWPKSDATKPYTNISTTSSIATSWLGTTLTGYSNQYTGGQLLSASKYDDCNIHNLVNTLPEHIISNPDNDQYVLFVEMIGQYFDGIWNYIESISDVNDANSNIKKGISKELVYEALSQTGISAFDQFENINLFEYLLATNKDGTFGYTTTDGTRMVSASLDSALPKQDISKEVWKRLYHNVPYLLKTKGTERGIKALMACYGIPESILHVKEYGGPTADKTGFRTFSYQKESKMLTQATVGGSGTILDTSFPTSSKTVQVRFLPNKTVTEFDVLSFADGDGGVGDGLNDFSVGISQSLDPTLIDSGTFAHLVIASGSNEGGANPIVAKVSSSLGPIFNGGVWNLSVVLNSGSSEGNSVTAYATYATFNKNIFTLSCSLDIPNYFEGVNNSTIVGVGNSSVVGSSGVTGTLIGPFSGSVQEYRAWFEKLDKETIVTQSLSPFNYNGNTIGSSYESLYLRIPLGSDNQDPERAIAINNAPNSDYHSIYTANVANTSELTYIEETHHLTTPDTVGSSMVSDKVRLDTGVIDNDWLHPFISVETDTQDRQPLDYSDLGVFFSPTFEINEDIIYTLGGFRLDDYIGDPRHYTSSDYPDLKTIRDIYFQKVDRKFNFKDYIRTIQFFDHTLFKIIRQFTPAKANLKTGLVIEPHYLERTKYPGKKITQESKTEYLLEYNTSGSVTGISETEYLAEYNIGSTGVVDFENNAINSRLSSRYRISNIRDLGIIL